MSATGIRKDRIEEYSRSFADCIFNSFYKDQDFFTGEDILTLCHIEQVNRLIIKILFDHWRQDIEKMYQTPYFNYKHKNVQVALKEFMNIASKHILVNKQNLKPLVETAISKSITLIFCPSEFYKNEIHQFSSPKLSINNLVDLKKYIKINNHYLNIMIEKIEALQVKEILQTKALSMLHEIESNLNTKKEKSRHEMKHYLNEYSQVAPLTIEDIFESSPLPAPEPVPEKNIPIKVKEPSLQEEEQQQTNKNKTTTIEQNQQENATPQQIQKVLKKDAPSFQYISINIFKSQKNVTINQRIMFINNLFNKDESEFEAVINFLDNCNNYKDALNFIQLNYAEPNNWDMNSEVLEEFIELIETRFRE